MKVFYWLMFFSTILFSSEIKWEKSLFDAQLKTTKTGKPIMVLITTDKCKWCKKLEATTLQDDDVIDLINLKYLPVHLIKGKADLPTTFKAPMVPMTIFVDKDNRILYSAPGLWDAEDFEEMMQRVGEAKKAKGR